LQSCVNISLHLGRVETCQRDTWWPTLGSQTLKSSKYLQEWQHKKYGGKVLARGPLADRHEGKLTGTVMMIEFESKKAAETFYFSEEYQAAKAVRETCSDTDLMIIEGAE
jgi:uncharacterized protein (DUF1330 family)